MTRLFAIVALALVLGACGASAPPAPPAPASKVTTVAAMHFVKETKAGRTSALTFSLRNDGQAASAPVAVNIGSEYFDGFTVRSSTPTSLGISGKGGAFRTIKFAALQPGEQQDYSIDQQANAPGDYKFWGYIAADAANPTAEVTKWSERVVVLR